MVTDCPGVTKEVIGNRNQPEIVGNFDDNIVSMLVTDSIRRNQNDDVDRDGTNSSFALGSLSSCALKFASDANTGIISPGPDQLSLVTGGVARLTIDSAGAVTIPGNVSIAGDLNVTGAQNSNIALIVALG